MYPIWPVGSFQKLQQKPNNIIIFLKIKTIVKFAGTAQSSSAFPKT